VQKLVKSRKTQKRRISEIEKRAVVIFWQTVFRDKRTRHSAKLPFPLLAFSMRMHKTTNEQITFNRTNYPILSKPQ